MHNDLFYKGIICSELSISLSRNVGSKMSVFTENHPILGRVFCPFVCLGSFLAKLALRVLSIVEPILITPFACLIGRADDRLHGFKQLIPSVFFNLLALVHYTFLDLWFQGTGTLIGFIYPRGVFAKMDYGNSSYCCFD